MKMKKKMKKVCLLVGVVLAATAIVMKTSRPTNMVDSLLMENIEALAEDEHVWVNPSCYGDGNVTCPINKVKVAYVMDRYSLE